jgi:hypothetical protein
MSSAAWYEWIGLVAWLGTLILYPVWFFWFGRVLLRTSSTAEMTTPA